MLCNIKGSISGRIIVQNELHATQIDVLLVQDGIEAFFEEGCSVVEWSYYGAKKLVRIAICVVWSTLHFAKLASEYVWDSVEANINMIMLSGFHEGLPEKYVFHSPANSYRLIQKSPIKPLVSPYDLSLQGLQENERTQHV